MTLRAGLAALAMAGLAAAISACSSTSQHAKAATQVPSTPPVVYVALGASETVGVGTRDPVRDAFPQQLFQHLGHTAVMFNFGLPGETTAGAVKDELPGALAVRPTLATVWFNVNDLVAGVASDDYQARLDEIVAGLRGAGARVLLANTPHLDRLPAFLACEQNPPAGSVKCPLSSLTPAPGLVDAKVQAYNAAVAHVAQRNGATLVDLYSAGEVADLHPEYVSGDGLHPSAEGAAAIAAAFAQALG